jgi:hypothetical protein
MAGLVQVCCRRGFPNDYTAARLPPLASLGLRGLEPFRAGRKAGKHERGLCVPALVLVFSVTHSVQVRFSLVSRFERFDCKWKLRCADLDGESERVRDREGGLNPPSRWEQFQHCYADTATTL